METIPKEQLLKLIEVGIQAPSADNCQPWKFKLLNDGFELWLDKNNMGLFFDINHVATQISCGALIENVVTLAKAFGLSSQVNYFSDSVDALAGERKFAQLQFTETGDRGDSENISKTLYSRHTNRNLFEFNKQIPDAVMSELSATVNSDDYFLQVYQSSQTKKTIINTITATDTIRFIHEQIHHDFYKVLRFGKSAETRRDGLAAATLGIEAFMIPILERLRPWKLTKFLNYFGLHHVMAFRGTWLPMKSASQIVAIVHKGEADYVASGRIMQRFWVQANKAGVSVQPLGALPLFLARLHQVCGEGFSLKQLKSLEKIEADFVNITPDFDENQDQLIMLFRLGYVKKSVQKPYRRSVESFYI